jgi:SPP1 family predicted phage head-tail adaptor
MMKAGELDRRISIEDRFVTNSDSGEEIITWLPLITVWAKKVEAKGSERFAGQELFGAAVKTFHIRWSLLSSTITTKHKLIHDGRTYDITDVREIGRREGLEIDAYTKSEEPIA